MSALVPNTTPTEVEVTTRDREHLSGVIYRTLGFVNNEVLVQTLNQNPHLAEMPPLYPANTKIVINIDVEQSNEQEVLTLWT